MNTFKDIMKEECFKYYKDFKFVIHIKDSDKELFEKLREFGNVHGIYLETLVIKFVEHFLDIEYISDELNTLIHWHYNFNVNDAETVKIRIAEEWLAALQKIEQIKLQEQENKAHKKEEPIFINDITLPEFRTIIFEYLKEGRNGRNRATDLCANAFIHKYRLYTLRYDKLDEMWIYSDGIYVPQGRTYVIEFIRTILGSSFNMAFCNETLAKIKADTYIDENDFFTEEPVHLIPVLNGILDLRTRVLSEYTHTHKFFNKINATFDRKKDCTNFRKHLKAILKEEKDIETIQELFGYCLLREYKIEKAFMLNGTGRNGKGKTLTVLKTLLNPKNCCSISIAKLESKDFLVNVLHRKYANICGDMGSDALKQTEIFKQATGQDQLTADRKFLSTISFVNYAKMIFATNALPKTTDTSIGFWDRWVILDFPYTFKIKSEYNKYTAEDIKKENIKLADEDIIKKLTTPDEMSGILNFALDGLDRLLKNKGFTKSSTSVEIEKLWIRKSSSINAFIMDEVQYDYGSKIFKNSFRDAYMKYCQKHKLKKVSDKEIYQALTSNVNASSGQDFTTKERYWENVSWIHPEDKLQDTFSEGMIDNE